MYISRDVVFDEHVFPFSELHPNAGKILKNEILLLPPSLIPCVDGSMNNRVVDVTNASNLVL